MRTFVAINDAGSLSAAAAAMNRAPPTVVRSLAVLEAALGVRLLNRTTRSMSLTAEGQVFLERARRILADVDEAEQLVTATRIEPRGLLRITAPVLFGQLHVGPAVHTFLSRYADVRADLLLVDRVVDLVEEGLHAGVRIGNLPDSSLVAVPVGQVRRVVVASPALLARSGRPEHPDQLLDLPCVGHTGVNPAGRWRFQVADRQVTIQPRCVLVTNEARAAVDACVAGVGFAAQLSYQVAEHVRAGRLQVVLADHEVKPLTIQVVYPSVSMMSTRLRLFVEHLRSTLVKRDDVDRG